MKNLILTTILSMVTASSVFAADIPCQREATIAAFRAVLEDKELNLSNVKGLAIKEAGVYLNKKTRDKVSLTVNLGLTENGYERSEIVQVELNPSYDNACQVESSKILAGE